ncbi:hypothetical protein BAE44_0005915, partial [Dichanthelium oligosanthes]
LAWPPGDAKDPDRPASRAMDRGSQDRRERAAGCQQQARPRLRQPRRRPHRRQDARRRRLACSASWLPLI